MKENMLDLYSDFVIVQNKYATATGLLDLSEGKISHDKITRFLNKSHLFHLRIFERTSNLKFVK